MPGIDAAMFELFREEVKAHADTLATGLIAAEAAPTDPALLEGLMRAAHSIKGAARIVGIDTAVRLAHVMEDALVAAQDGKIKLKPADTDTLLQGTDVLAGLAALTQDNIGAWEATTAAAVAALEPVLVAMARGESLPAPASVATPREAVEQPLTVPQAAASPFPPTPAFDAATIPTEPFALGPAHSMLDLFREEVRGHLHGIARALPALTSDPTAGEPVLEALKQLCGAARLVKCDPVAALAGALGAYLRATRAPPAPALGWARYAVAIVAGALATDDDTFGDWAAASAAELARIAEVFGRAAAVQTPREEPPTPKPTPPAPLPEERAGTEPSRAESSPVPRVPVSPPPLREGGPGGVGSPVAVPADQVVRVTAQSLNRLMGLAGESLVQARWLPTFSTSLLKLKKQHDLLAKMLDTAFHAAVGGTPPERVADLIADTRRQWTACKQELHEKTGDFDDHAARAEDLNARLYREVIASRMRPFGDGSQGLPRLVRDMARALGKEAKLVVAGERTEVDRDILEKLESPLSHLIRNAVDHGLEPTDARTAAGKPAAGTITLEARHRAGMLHVTVSDDGAGIDLNRLREKVIDRGLNAPDVAARLTEAELLEFLFLPGFSTAASVTEFSGRGVGLDVVQDTVRKVGGNVRITTARGKGTTFHLQLPLTLSVIRAVVVDVAGEPYAFPHTRIDRLIRVRRDAVRSIEHRQFVTVDGANVGLVIAGQLLDIPSPTPNTPELPVVLLGDGTGEYGLIVDSFRGEQDLVVRPLDARLGKVPNLSAAAILDDGSPVLIVDVEDLLRSMDQFIQTGSLVRCETRPSGLGRKKRVLVVDDSITVREVERQLLLHKGYEVAVAVDGMDGWNKVRAERYDLLVSDIDMPRMNGLQLVQAVRADDRLRDLPVIIVSYKEREEDRMRGLEVGANAYLTKSSFHDNRFMEAVVDLIGVADGV
ncbi:MAG: hybrid sensor histidine kinase/response regulator [Planctomycetes bacterium]|nr:hybrid sensor histidine kinase/response regulator [Planctomycetota bacterium]